MPKITQGSKEKDDGARDSIHFIQTQAIHSSIPLVIHSYTFIPPSFYSFIHSFIHTHLFIHPSNHSFIPTYFIHPSRQSFLPIHFIHPSHQSFIHSDPLYSLVPSSHSFLHIYSSVPPVIHSYTLYSSVPPVIHSYTIYSSILPFIQAVHSSILPFIQAVHSSILPFIQAIHSSIRPSIHSFHFIHPLRTLHKIVLQEMTTTMENTARHENITKLGLKTTDKSCKAALLNEKLCVLDAAVPLVCSPLLTSATKSKLLPFLLKSWMFLLSTCSQQQQLQQHPWEKK